jgi:hypothetical protein
MRPASVTTPATRPPAHPAAARRRLRDHRAARLRALRQQGHGLPGFGPGIRRGVEPATHGALPLQHFRDRPRSAWVSTPDGRGNVRSRPRTGHLAVGLGEVEDAGLPEAQALAEFRRQRFPDRRLSIMIGNSPMSRPCWRTQPQLRLDCSPAMRPFSQSVTEGPVRRRNHAVITPMTPPPMHDHVGRRRDGTGRESGWGRFPGTSCPRDGKGASSGKLAPPAGVA